MRNQLRPKVRHRSLRGADTQLIYEMLIECVIIDSKGRYILNADSEAERFLNPQEVRILKVLEHKTDMRIGL